MLTLIRLVALLLTSRLPTYFVMGSEVLIVAVKSWRVLNLGFRWLRHKLLDSTLERGVRPEFKDMIDGGLLDRNNIG